MEDNTTIADDVRQIKNDVSVIKNTMPEPENRGIRAFELVSTAVGICGIVSIIAQIITWAGG